MGPDPQGIFVVSVRDVEDIEGAKRQISEIGGVVDVEHNHLTQKFLIRYEGDRARLAEIELELKQVLQARSRASKQPPRPLKGKRRQ